MNTVDVRLLLLMCCGSYSALTLELPQLTEPVIHLLQVHTGPTTSYTGRKSPTTPPQQYHDNSTSKSDLGDGAPQQQMKRRHTQDCFHANASLHLAYHPINHDRHVVLWDQDAEVLLWAPLPGWCTRPCWNISEMTTVLLRLLHERHAEGTDGGLGAVQCSNPSVRSIHSITVSLNEPAAYSSDSVSSLRASVRHDALQLLPAVQPPPTVVVSNAHHLHHSSYAFYTSPFQRALVLSIDGGGSDGHMFTIWNASRDAGQPPTLLSACDLCIVAWLYEAVTDRRIGQGIGALSLASVSVLPDLQYAQRLEHFLRTVRRSPSRVVIYLLGFQPVHWCFIARGRGF